MSVVETPVVYAGSTVKLAGSNFKPGQQVQFFYEGQSISGSPVTADAEGKFTVQTAIPAQAAPGRHPVVVSVTDPAAALVYPLKVSPNVPLSGAERFEVQTEKLVPGLYQSAYSAKNNTVFVTSAVGRPPVTRSELVKLNADTLQIEKRVSPAEAPARRGRDGTAQPGGLFAVYGVGVDDANGNVWVTVTRQNTVAVYRQSDLALVKQFEPGAASHARDVVIDERHGKAFISAARSPNVEVFDTKTLQKTASIVLESGVRGPAAQPFATMSLALDAASNQLFVVSAGGEVAVINTATNAVEKVLPVKDAFSASGVAYDAATGRLFVAAQGSDNVVILDAKSGEVLQNVLVGAGALNVAFDPVKRLAYVSNRGSGTLTVLDVDGNIVANLDNKPLPNHVSVGPNGVIYAVNKGPADHEDSDNIKRIQPK
ncbi:YncE family protein [Corticibacter populi]|uniref:YncE family protein n=1 Tax=Corticibacter populi TaxID=1550736 RepID=A0A3M6QK58_9BURK|nr:YncE family protein [Corticibacter populi]